MTVVVLRLAAVLCIATLALSGNPQSLQESYEQAERLFSAGDLKAAAAKLSLLLKNNANIPEVHNMLGAIHASTGSPS